MMIRPLFVSLFLVTSCFARLQAGAVTINGISYIGTTDTITLQGFSDYITESRITLARAPMEASGKFSFQLDIEDVTFAMVRFNGTDYSLYIEPGKTYNVEIVEPDFPLSFPGQTDTNELNFAIGRFDYDFGNFTAVNYENFMKGNMQAVAQHFSDSITAAYAGIENPFFQDYIRYRLASMMMACRAIGPKKAYDNYLGGQSLLFHNGEYMYFFTLYYDNYFSTLILQRKGKNIQKALLNGIGFDSLAADVQRSAWVSDSATARFVALYGLMQSYYSEIYKKDLVENLLYEAYATETNPDYRAFLDALFAITGRLKPGKEAPALTGKDIEGNEKSLADWKGKAVYLSFFNPTEAESVKEIKGIEALYDKFKRDAVFITVCSNCSYSSLSKFIKDNELKWNFLVISPEAEQEFEVLRYPAFFLINKEGVLEKSPALSPSEGIFQDIYDLTQKIKPQR